MAISKDSFFTPSLIKAEMNQIQRGVINLDSAITKSRVSGEFKKEWRRFVGDWILFARENDSWFKRALNSTRDLVVDYSDLLRQWRDEFLNLGGKLDAPVISDYKSRSILPSLLLGASFVSGGLFLYSRLFPKK